MGCKEPTQQRLKTAADMKHQTLGWLRWLTTLDRWGE
jgi:hypothetical protein